MQTRIANRQDEKEIRALTEVYYQKDGSSLDIEGKDNDLRNIEGNYIGKNGIFLVTEGGDNSINSGSGKVLAYLAARQKPEHNNNRQERSNLVVERLLVSEELPTDKADELIVKLMDITLNHAYQADFAGVEINHSIYKWIKPNHAAFKQRELNK